VAEGLQRATLAALLTRGPWKSADGEFDAVGLQRVYDAVVRGPGERGWIRFPWANGDRRTDRALQLLRKAGLIEFAGTPRRWRVREVPNG
jgi:hypothetical protein